MAVNIGFLKQEEVRKKIAIIIDNKEEFITVKNAIGSQRERLIKVFEEKSLEESEGSATELVKIILQELTDLEIDGDISDIINNPTTEMSLVLHEVNEIMHELLTQFWTGKIRQLNQSVIMLLTAHASQRTNVILELTKDLEDSKESVTNLAEQLDSDYLNLPIIKQKKNKGNWHKGNNNG